MPKSNFDILQEQKVASMVHHINETHPDLRAARNERGYNTFVGLDYMEHDVLCFIVDNKLAQIEHDGFGGFVRTN